VSSATHNWLNILPCKFIAAKCTFDDFSIKHHHRSEKRKYLYFFFLFKYSYFIIFKAWFLRKIYKLEAAAYISENFFIESNVFERNASLKLNPLTLQLALIVYIPRYAHFYRLFRAQSSG